MGRTTQIRFVLNLRDVTRNGKLAGMTPIEWRPRGRKLGCVTIPADGTPSADNIARWVAAFERSTRRGGVNAHLGAMTIGHAWIYDQERRLTLATWTRTEQTLAAAAA